MTPQQEISMEVRCHCGASLRLERRLDSVQVTHAADAMARAAAAFWSEHNHGDADDIRLARRIA